MPLHAVKREEMEGDQLNKDLCLRSGELKVIREKAKLTRVKEMEEARDRDDDEPGLRTHVETEITPTKQTARAAPSSIGNDTGGRSVGTLKYTLTKAAFGNKGADLRNIVGVDAQALGLGSGTSIEVKNLSRSELDTLGDAAPTFDKNDQEERK